MAGAEEMDVFPNYIPAAHYTFLVRERNGEMVSIDSFVASAEGVPCAAGLRCPICYVNAGEETPETCYDPEHPGDPLRTRNDAFVEQTTFVTLPCCRQPIHRGCLLHRWLDCSRLNPGIGLPTQTHCAICRQRVLDEEADCEWAIQLVRMLQGCRQVMREIDPCHSQELPPGHKLEGDKLAMLIGLCFLSALEDGECWAKEALSKKVATAARTSMVALDGQSFYCRGQVFGLMMAEVQQVVQMQFGKSVGAARMSGELAGEHQDFFSHALLTAVRLYTMYSWYWYWKPFRADLFDGQLDVDG